MPHDGSEDDDFYNRGEPPPQDKSPPHGEQQKPLLYAYTPRPFAEIPKRQWLHAGHYIRRYVVMTVAPGGWGKSSLVLCNAIEMVTAKGFLTSAAPIDSLRVLYWNAEDPEDETDRLIAALCLRHNIDPQHLAGRLFLGTKLGIERLAHLDQKGAVSFHEKRIKEVTDFIGNNKIDCAIFDPLIAFHKVPERGEQMQEVIERFGTIANATNSCIELSQHTRKPAPGQQGELTADDSRGTGAIVFAARSVRVLNRMTAEEAKMPKVSAEDRRYHLRVNRDKVNLVRPGQATWFHLHSVDLPNGDEVQAAEAWSYPQAFDSVTEADMHWIRNLVRDNPNYRKDQRSPEWVGCPLADRLKLNAKDAGDKAGSARSSAAGLATGCWTRRCAMTLNDARANTSFLALGRTIGRLWKTRFKGCSSYSRDWSTTGADWSNQGAGSDSPKGCSSRVSLLGGNDWSNWSTPRLRLE